MGAPGGDGDRDHGHRNILPGAVTRQGSRRPVPDSLAWSSESWAGPAARSRSSGSAPGSSAPTGARSREEDALAVLRGVGRGGRDVLRHRRRVRRRAQRAGHRAVPDGRTGGITVATKMGRRVDQVPENYTLDNFRAWTDRSRRNLGVDTLDLVQLHCPPSAVIDADATYDDLDTLVAEGAIAAYGVSVETCDAGAVGDRPAERRLDPDHPQRVPAQAARRGAAGGRGGRRRDHRAGAAGVRAAVGEVRREHDVRGRRPPHLQPRTARRSTWARRSRAWTTRPAYGPPRSSPRWSTSAAVGRDAGAGRARVDRAAARRLDGDPRRPQRRPGPGERGGRRAADAACRVCATAWPGCTTATSARRSTRAGSRPAWWATCRPQAWLPSRSPQVSARTACTVGATGSIGA